MKKFRLLCWLVIVLFSQSVISDITDCTAPEGNGLFNASICIDDKQINYSGKSAESLIDQFSEEELKNYFGDGYDKDTSRGTLFADFRGLEMKLHYPHGSNELVFEVPSLDISKTFTGTNRDDSNEKLRNYLKQDGDAILKELIAQSAVSPIAGNPSSAQTTMTDNDFNSGTNGSFDIGFHHKISTIGLELGIGSYEQGGHQVNTYSLPLSYSFSFGKGRELSFRMPITYVDIEGATSYSIVSGISYKQPVNEYWALTPSISYGIAGSEDLGAAAQMASASLTSNYFLVGNKTAKYAISMANMIAYFQTLPLNVGGYNLDPELTNQIMRNGLLFNASIGKLLNTKITMGLFITDTRIFGDDVFMNQYNEVGISIGPEQKNWREDVKVYSQQFSIGIKYLYSVDDIDVKSDGITGWNLALNYKF